MSSSVSSLLTARESDPEDVLKGLGFRGPTVLDRIPRRFISTGTICDGVDSEQFLSSVQDDCEDGMCTVSRLNKSAAGLLSCSHQADVRKRSHLLLRLDDNNSAAS